MSQALRAAVAAAALGLPACASVPRDSGFADVQQAVRQETEQPVEWNPRAPVEPPDDAAVQPLLEQEMTADLAVRIAFAQNRDVQATLEELGIARAELIASRTLRNPVFDGEVRFPGDPRAPFEIGLIQPLIDIFQLPARRKLGQARFEAARVEVGASIVQFASEVRTHYYDLLAARKVLARQADVLKAQEAAAELAGRQHAAGNISDLDLENEQSRLEQVKLDHAKAQLDELEARERLVADLGLARRADLRLPPDFPAFPERERTAGEVEAQVPGRRLDLRLAEREIEVARRAAGVARGAAFEELAAGVHHEREPEGKSTTGPAASIPIPIFDRGTAPRARARAQLRQAQQRLNALTVSARSEARAAHERLLEARARFAYLREVALPRRERILRLTQLEYNAMLRGVYPLIEARQDLDRARREEVLAARDYWVARTELEAALQGVSGFSIRPERAPAGRDRFAPATPQDTKEKE